jgi:hypothetical protein
MSENPAIPAPFFCLAANVRIPRTIAECDAALAFVKVRSNSIQQQIEHDKARGITRSEDALSRREFAQMRWETRAAEFLLRKEQLIADADIEERLAECKKKYRRQGQISNLNHNALMKLRAAVVREVTAEFPDAACQEALPEPMQRLMAEATRPIDRKMMTEEVGG